MISSILATILRTEDPSESILPQVHNDNKIDDEIPDNMCVECGDQPKTLFCEQCQDDYCDMCFQSQHRKGNRKKHNTKKLTFSAKKSASIDGNSVSQTEEITFQTFENSEQLVQNIKHIAIDDSAKITRDFMLNRSKFIPLRLRLSERKYMRLVDGMLDVSEYTDKVDILSYHSKKNRIFIQLKEVCAILTGMVTACDYKEGQKLLQNVQFIDNKEFYQIMFEIARRHKIRNPEKMRSSYVKLIHLLQDSVIPEIEELLEFSCIKPIVTVYSFLEKHNALNVLTDDLQSLLDATSETESEGKQRSQINRELRENERRFDRFCEKYSSDTLPKDELHLAIRSICDNHSFLKSNRDPVDKMIKLLKDNFDPEKEIGEDKSLAIS